MPMKERMVKQQLAGVFPSKSAHRILPGQWEA